MLQNFSVPAPRLVGIEPNPGPPGSKHLSIEKRWNVVFWAQERHLTISAIARKMNIKRESVRAILQKYHETGDVKNRVRSGRKKEADGSGRKEDPSESEKKETGDRNRSGIQTGNRKFHT